MCLHEEDAGMLWKHTDTRLGHVEVRRNRRLVVSMVSTFANYEYAMYWNFYLVGNTKRRVVVPAVGRLLYLCLFGWRAPPPQPLAARAPSARAGRAPFAGV